MLAAKFFSSSNNGNKEALWSQNPWHKDAAASTEKDELGQIVFSHNMHVTSATTLVTPLKIILVYV